MQDEQVDHPDHYGGKDNPYETIKIWAALGWLVPACLANAMKYIMRAGKKGTATYNHSREDSVLTPCPVCLKGQQKATEDIKKAIFYLQYLVDEKEGKHPKPVHVPVQFVPLSDLQTILDQAKQYAEMGRDYPTSGASNLLDHLEETIISVE